MKFSVLLLLWLVFTSITLRSSAMPYGRIEGEAAYGKQNQTIVFDPPTDLRYGDVPIQLVATASSGLPVVFSVVSGPATIKNDSLVLTGAGKVVVLASQQGDANYNAAPPQERSININKANQTITFDKLSARTMLESPFNLLATTSSGLSVELTVAAGPATLQGNALSLTGEGLVTIRAYQAGNEFFNSAPYVNQSFTVSKAEQTILFKDLSDRILPSDPFFNEPFPLLVEASSNLPVSLTIPFGPVVLTGNQVTLKGAGKVYVRASQAGNAIYQAITIDTAFCVLPAPPLISVNGLQLTSSSTLGNQWFLEGTPVAGATSKIFKVQQNGTYSVQVANPDAACGPSPMSEPVNVYITGLEEVTSAWEVYPNPARDWLAIRSSTFKAHRIVRVRWLTPAGQVLAEHSLFPDEQGEVRLNLAATTAAESRPGLYFLEISAGKQTLRQKIMVQ